jgi:hypothetical protein
MPYLGCGSQRTFMTPFRLDISQADTNAWSEKSPRGRSLKTPNDDPRILCAAASTLEQAFPIKENWFTMLELEHSGELKPNKTENGRDADSAKCHSPNPG